MVPADNLTTAIDSYPEHPKIKRTRTRGLPVTERRTQKVCPVTGLGSGRPGLMTDPQDTAPAWSRRDSACRYTMETRGVIELNDELND